MPQCLLPHLKIQIDSWNLQHPSTTSFHKTTSRLGCHLLPFIESGKTRTCSPFVFTSTLTWKNNKNLFLYLNKISSCLFIHHSFPLKACQFTKLAAFFYRNKKASECYRGSLIIPKRQKPFRLHNKFSLHLM